LNSPYVCKGCGRPLQRITQYCIDCESTGPHDPVSRVGNRKVRAKRQAWLAKASSHDETPTRRAKISEQWEKRPTPPDDSDKDIRSLYARKPHKRNLSTAFWRNAAAILASVFLIGIIYLYRDTLGALRSNLGQMVSGIHIPVENKTVTVAVQPPVDINQGSVKNDSASGQNPVTTPVVVNNSENKTTTVSTDISSAADTGVSTPSNTPVSTDIQPPQITNIAYVATDYSVTISWETDEKASSFIKYGTDLSLAFPSTDVPQLTLDHSIYVNGLTPNTRYHYKIFSTDAAGNAASTGDDRTFTTQPTTNSAPYSGSVAPDFTLNNLQNNEISLSQFRGKKVILNFWASWCNPCKMELPDLQAIWSKHRNSSDVMLLTVAGSQSDMDAIKDFMAQNNFDFTVCIDENDGVFNTYGITSIPRTYFLDKNGVICKIQQSMFTSSGEVEFMLDSY
jgi:peroxiredoxin